MQPRDVQTEVQVTKNEREVEAVGEVWKACQHAGKSDGSELVLTLCHHARIVGRQKRVDRKFSLRDRLSTFEH